MKHILQSIIVAVFLILTSCQSEHKDLIELNKSPETLELFSENYVSTNLYERDIAISPSGNEIIYTLGNHNQTIRSLVSIQKKANGIWDDKKILSFSGTYNDIEPFFSLDGNQLFFASNRPINDTLKKGDYNIWVVQKLDSDWGNPVILNSNINTDKDEFYPSVSRNGNLYFTATRDTGIGREDIFMSEFKDGNYQPAKVLDSMINTKMFEFNAYISPNEDLLIFSSYGRSDDLGGGDLYYSKKDNQGHWSASKNMGDIVNSKSLDYCPFIDYTNHNFYFTSNRTQAPDKRINTIEEFTNISNSLENGLGNIYRIHINALDLN